MWNGKVPKDAQVTYLEMKDGGVVDRGGHFVCDSLRGENVNAGKVSSEEVESASIICTGTVTAESVSANSVVGVSLTGTLTSGTQTGITGVGTQTQDLDMGGNNVTNANGVTAGFVKQVYALIQQQEPVGYGNGMKLERHKTRLLDVSDSSTLASGQSSFTNDTENDTTTSHISAVLSVTAQSLTFKLQHYSEKTMAAFGLGITTQTGELEVYGELRIRKIG